MAQSADTAPSLVRTVLEEGHKLEVERRWHEAVLHYEQALRQLPSHTVIQDRLDAARIHWDVVRRCRDGSFIGSLRSLSTRDALAVYDEVLAKIETYYVRAPDWRRLVHHGWRTWQTAVTEPEFLTLNGWTQNPVSRELADRLYGQMSRFRLVSRRDAYDAAAYCAQWLEEHAQVPARIVVLEFVSGAVTALDEYSSFLTAGQLDEVFSQIEGNFVGVGVEVKPEPFGLLIVSVIPGGPAEEAGIVAGERIIAVAGQSLRELTADRAADQLRGPAGSRVEITVTSRDGVPRNVLLTRRRVEVPSVDRVQMLDPEHGVGYFRLSNFQKSTPREVDSALWQLHRQGMRSLIIDLRGNPGGLLTAAVEAADRFLSDGPIVATRGRHANEDYDYRAHGIGTWKMPLVVMVDSESASASEIFAAAIHEQRRGVLVGQRTFGKGSVQGIFPLQTARAGVRLTTALFFGPSGQPISRHGVAPDILVHSVAKPTNAADFVNSGGEDLALNIALQSARDLMAQVVVGR